MSDFLKQFNLFKFHTKLYLAGWYFTLVNRMKFRTDGLEFLIPKEVTNIKFRGQFPIDFYEKQERRYLKKYLQSNATVLDLGGCLGVVSCLVNKQLQRPERHVVVEANPNMIPYLETNRVHNNCRFAIENCVVTDQPSLDFNLGNTILMSSTRRPTGRKISVPGKTVAQLEQEHKLKFDTLVMDIEGGELDFLRENRDKLQQLSTIFLEVHPHKDILTLQEVEECRQIMQDAGLQQVVDDTGFWIMQRPTSAA